MITVTTTQITTCPTMSSTTTREATTITTIMEGILILTITTVHAMDSADHLRKRSQWN
jgi:hypothetical protein